MAPLARRGEEASLLKEALDEANARCEDLRCKLQAAVLTMSTGPVCPSDGIGYSDVPLIMRSAAADGTLLQPDRPATAIDAYYDHRAFGASATVVECRKEECDGRFAI